MPNIEAFQKLANKEYELVLMRVAQAFTPWNVGDLAGFPPDAALDAFNKGFAVPCDQDGNEIKFKAPKPAAVEPKSPDGTIVAIPDAWEKLHHLQRVKLAKELGGVDITTKEQADVFIQAEVERRAAGAGEKPAV